ncbi:hypothetical protein EI94DRAFT_1736247, partial [Lactarius quietus]
MEPQPPTWGVLAPRRRGTLAERTSAPKNESPGFHLVLITCYDRLSHRKYGGDNFFSHCKASLSPPEVNLPHSPSPVNMRTSSESIYRTIMDHLNAIEVNTTLHRRQPPTTPPPPLP